MTIHKRRQYLLIELISVSSFAFILLVSLGSQFLQKEFINLKGQTSLLGIVALGFLVHLVYLFKIEQWSQNNWVQSFLLIVHVLLASALAMFSGMGQSIFFFLYLINILLAGLVLQTKGALLITLLSSILYNLTMMLSGDVRGQSFLFQLALNNLAFFGVAALSGHLSEQMNFMGLELAQKGRDLLQLKNFNELVLEHIPSGVVSVQASGAILFSNSRASDILDLKHSSISNLFQVLPEFQGSFASNQGLSERECALKQPNGEFRYLSLAFKAIEGYEDYDRTYVGVINDVTEIRQMEFAMRQAEKMAAVGQLAAGIAHEIRNPLASISGSVEMLESHASSEDDKKLFRIILRETDRLNNLISEFLDYAKPAQAPTEQVVLSQIVDEVLLLLANNKKVPANVQIIRDFKDAGRILGDVSKLKQAILNIIINALQAMEKSEVPELFIGISQGESVSLTIRDKGAGMNEQVKKRMFEPFHTTKPKGTGLGLAMTHKILQSHKAQIIVESRVGEGTEFIIRFPLLKVS